MLDLKKKSENRKLFMNYFYQIMESLIRDSWVYDSVMLTIDGFESCYYSNGRNLKEFWFCDFQRHQEMIGDNLLLGFDFENKIIKVYSRTENRRGKTQVDFSDSLFGLNAWDELIFKVDNVIRETSKLDEIKNKFIKLIKKELFVSHIPEVKLKEELVDCIKSILLDSSDNLEDLFPLLLTENPDKNSILFNSSNLAESLFGTVEKMTVSGVVKMKWDQNHFLIPSSNFFKSIGIRFFEDNFVKIADKVRFTFFNDKDAIIVASMIEDFLFFNYPGYSKAWTDYTTFWFFKRCIIGEELYELDSLLNKKIYNELNYLLEKENKIHSTGFIRYLYKFDIAKKEDLNSLSDAVVKTLDFLLKFRDPEHGPINLNIELNDSLEQFNFWISIADKFVDSPDIIFEVNSFSTNKQVPVDFFLKDEAIVSGLSNKSISINKVLIETLNEINSKLDKVLELSK